MLHTHFYKISTSVCLLYTFFYLNNIILNFFYYSQLYPGPTNFNTHAIYDLYLFLFLFHFLFFFLLFLLLLSSSPFFLLQRLRLSSSFAKERKLFVGKFFFAFSSCSFAILVWLFIWVWWFFFLGEGLMNLGSWFRSSLKNFMICCWI